MKTSNPVINNLSSGDLTNSGRTLANSDGSLANSVGTLTANDIVQKTGITLAVIVVFASFNFGIAVSGNQSLSMILTVVGAIGGLIAVLVAAFSKNGYSSKLITLTYATFEGLFVGGLSLLLSGYMVGDSDAGMLIGQAIIGTVGVFMSMLWLYKSGKFQVTSKFNKIMLILILGVLFATVVNLLVYMFTGINVLRDGGPIAIAFSVFCIVLAALSFMTDFDTADKLIDAESPKEMAWGVALGLAVTLVWLYTEILRLLRYFKD